jgi:hypothetical protein
VRTVRLRKREQDDAIEALLVDESVRVVQRGNHVRVQHGEPSHSRGSVHQLDDRSDDHGALPLAGKHGRTDAADRQRAADAQLHLVRDHGRRKALRERLLKHASP